MKIEKAVKAEHQKLIEIWESSVRATHNFLAERDLIKLKPLILDQYFDAVDLSVARNCEGEICRRTIKLGTGRCENGVFLRVVWGKVTK